MILAAGRGERMRPLTDTIPKPLLKVGGQTLIERLIQRLIAANLRDLVINHAHLGAQIEAALGDGTRLGVQISYSSEGHALETAGGIANALPLLGDAPFIAANADVLCDFDFARLRDRELGEHLAHLVLVPNPPQHPQGDFVLHEGRMVNAGTPRYTFSGIGLYRPELLRHIVAGEKAQLAPLLRAAAERGLVGAELHTGMWHDVGTPARLSALDAQFSAAQI